MSDDHEVLTSILDWFGQIEEWIPGAGQWAADLLIGPIPLAHANNAYDLADHWGRLADALYDAYEDVMQEANPILENWSGDGGAQAFVQQWIGYLEGLRHTAESAAQMQHGVQNFGLEVELMKFMAALNLIMLAVSLFMLVAAAIPTAGGSLTAAPGLVATCRIALGRAATNTVGKIASIAMRIVMKSLTRLFGELPAAIARRVIPAAVRAAVPRLAGIVAERIATGMAKNALGRMARSIAARGISKAVANRLAAQALRGLAGREIRGTLGRQASREAQRQLAREIRRQLLQKWARTEGRQVAQSALGKVAATQVEKSLLGREFAKYVGTRVAFGAGFMGGGNLLGQFGQIVSGNRTEGVDWSQVKTGALQGAAFGAGMFGGVLGHSVGGAVAGGGLTLGQEVYGYLESGHKDAIDWQAVGHSAGQGAALGVIFGGQTALQHANLSLPHTRIGSLRIGADVHVLPGDHGGFNVVATRANGREGLLLTSDGYVGFQGRDGVPHIPGEIAGRSDVTSVVDQHFANLRVDPPTTIEAGASTASPGGGRIDAPAARADTGVGAPARPGDGGGGGGGGGPRRYVSGGDSGTPTTENGRSPVLADHDTSVGERTGPDSTPAGAASGGERVPAGDRVRAGGDRLPVGEERLAAGTDAPRGADSVARSDALQADRPVAGEHGSAERGPFDRGPADRPLAGGDDIVAPARPADGVSHTAVDGAAPRRDGLDRDAVPPAGEHVTGRPEHPAPSGRDGGTAVHESGDGGPPPGGPPHDPTGARPETQHRGDEPVMRSAGAEVGEAPTAESVRQGTVRMELHPTFPEVAKYLDRNGFRLVEDPAGPRAVIRHLYDADGRTLLREEREVRHLDGMRFLDLEHEIDHVRQLIDRFDGELGTEAYRERANGTQVEMRAAPRILSPKYDTVVEYHVRLQEAIRLIERRVDPGLLREHLAGVDERRALMNQKVHPRDSTAQNWRREHFSDIPSLERRLGELRDGFDNVPPHDPTGPALFIQRGEDLPPMAKDSLSGRVDDAAPVIRPGDATAGDGGAAASSMASAGHEIGEAPTPRSIEQGTVRFREHPDFPRLEQELRDLGVTFHDAMETTPRHEPPHPNVRYRHVYDSTGREFLRIEREMHLIEDMRFLDFEYEVGHVRQMEDRTRFPDGPPATEARREMSGGDFKKAAAKPDVLGAKLAIVEYHVRLQEVLRLADRGVDRPILNDHLNGLEDFQDRYNTRVLRPRAAHREWANRHFPDIPELRRQVDDLRASLTSDSVPLDQGQAAPQRAGEHNRPLDEPMAKRGHAAAERPDGFETGEAGFEGWEGVGEVRGRGGVPAAAAGVDRGGRAGAGRGGVGGNGTPGRGDGGRDHDSGHRTDPSVGDQSRSGHSDHRPGEQDPPGPGDSSRRPVAPLSDDLGNQWGREPTNGDSGSLSESPRGRETGDLPLRLSREGSGAGDREGFAGGEPGGRDGGSHIRGGGREDSADAAGTGDLAAGRDEHGVDPYRLVTVDGPALEQSVAAPQEVAAALERELTGLVEGRVTGVADQPYRADWDPGARTLRVHYGDGLVVDVVVQVNESVPPGHSVVVRPPMESVEGGGWRQTEPAGVVLSSHVPGDPVARGAHVQDALQKAWRTLHGEVGEQLRPPDGHPRDASLPRDADLSADRVAPREVGAYAHGVGPARDVPAPDALRAFEDPAVADVPVRDIDGVGRHIAEPADLPAPAPLTPESVGQAIAGRNGPEQLGRWAGEHLTDRAENGGLRSKPLAELAATVDRLAEQAIDQVTLVPDRPPASEAWHHASPIEGTDFVPDGRAWHQPDVTVGELRRAVQGVLSGDFADGRVSHVSSDGPHVRVELADGGMRHFLPQVGEGMRDLAETTVRSGTPDDPHIVQVSHRVSADQLPRVWVHEITETLALRHARESRAQPHGLARRAMAAIGRIFGGGESAGPEAARVDSHVAARINERLHLQRLHDRAAGRPEEQTRLLREIDGLDRDLAAILHEPAEHGLLPGEAATPERVSPETIPHDSIPHDPAAERPQQPESTHDEHWAHRPWEQEGRRPSFDELIPQTEAEAARWRETIKHEFGGHIENQTFAGLRVRLDTSLEPISTYRDEVVLRLKIVTADGVSVGSSIRTFIRESDGTLSVRHNSLRLNPDMQGRGFASSFNDYMTDWYRESGVSHIEVHAVNRGAFVWARSGFDWAPNNEGRSVRPILDDLRIRIGLIDNALEGLRLGHADLPALRERYSGDTPELTAENMRYERDAAQAVVDRAREHPFGSPNYPTPKDIAMAGSRGEHGRDAVWIGKEALLGKDWNGVKTISDGVVLNPRVEPAGAHQITAARVPHSDFHGYARDEAVRRLHAGGLEPNTPDPLRRGEFAEDGAPSPYDLGRLAEVDYLLRLRADPVHAEYAARELAALRGHLELTPDEPGAARRQAVADEWLGRAGHDPATVWDAPTPRGARLATDLAVAARTPNGVPDPGAVAEFVARVRPLDVSAVRGVEPALEAFVREAIGNDQARLQAIAGGAGQGQSGAPVYLVRDESGRLVAVAKIFPDVEELVRELSALDRLGSPEFRTFDTPRVEGVAVVPGPEGTAGALIMSVAQGRSIFEMISDVEPSVDRPAALAELHEAVGAAATALAELHGRPAGTGGPVDTGFLRFNHGLARREAAAVAEFGERLDGYRFEAGALVTRVGELLDAGLAEPGGASLMHGDAHPGNVFWDPVHGITLIDAPHAHFAMDQAGRPIGTPARDYANMMERLAHFGYEARLSTFEVTALQTRFAETYAAAGGPPIPEAAVRAFAVRFALRDVLDTLTALRAIDQPELLTRSVRQEINVLRNELRTELGLLRRTLGWAHE